jgi:FkbM family methyltransferase
MGFFSGKINGLIKNARLAIDDVRQTWIDNFGSAELPKVRTGLFKDGIAVITPNEVNDRHGTGVILSRAFAGVEDILSIRTTDLHGDHNFGKVAIRINQRGLSNFQRYTEFSRILGGNSFRLILCVPYHEEELRTAIVLKEMFDAKLCVYIMDDNFIATRGIPGDLIKVALERADLRLAISPEMRDAYEYHFRIKFWLRPPVVTPASICTKAVVPEEAVLRKRQGIVIGSLWSNEALQSLAGAVSKAQIRVDWFGNSDASWLDFNVNMLAEKGIRVGGFIPETELSHRLRDYAFALVPSGSLDTNDPRPEIARYSLPTRMPFLLAVGNIPTIVLGSPKTAAAGFVERFGLGAVTPYDGDRLRQAVDELCRPVVQARIREQAASFANYFSGEGVGRWIIESTERRRPITNELEQIFGRGRSDEIVYLPPEVPDGVYADFQPTYLALERLVLAGLKPDFVVDVGASTGIWSRSVSRLFPDAKFILVEPLLTRYEQLNAAVKKGVRNLDFVRAAISDQEGTARFQVSADLYGSSLLKPLDHREYEVVEVPAITLDSLQKERNLTGRGILKLDIQFAEHLALAGGQHFLESVDVVVVELTLMRLAKGARTLVEMVSLFSDLGFRYYDDVGEWRAPDDGTLVQKDVIFVRSSLFPFPGALP